jgi:hypothetical protein
VIVEEGEEKDLAFFFGVGGVGQFRAVHRVALPQVAKMTAFEAAVGLEALFGKQLGGGGAASGQAST